MPIDAKSTQVKVGSFLFDSKNTRIPADRRSDNQRQLLHELLAHEDIKSLAASISKHGLFKNERLIVMSTGRRYIVLEGNRRLAAIKLLLNPELAPTPSQVRSFRKLSSKADLAALGVIDVLIVQNRLSAAPIIAALHTGDSKRRWSSLQQAKFYHELAEEGLTSVEISDKVGVSLAQIRSFLNSEKLHRIALSLNLDAETRKAVENPKFPLTTLERFIESQTGRKFLGIELTA
ncbi:ParB N-terminal domain-containing protein [Methylohalobius crimeensis]|uniref:ParB N-terminal domain-containing protein n=1 Tax=Methylohalobius crimeensis TaxID=244365 RepID=UPI00190F3B50|nr:ParB N-terminal domain-containing protein [Methylohalobius crimeensis]